MNNIKITLIVFLLISSAVLFGGRYAGDFIIIGAGVRPLGMGGAFCAVADDGNAIYWNASGISQIKESEITVMHVFLYNNIASYDNISYCQPLPNDVTIGLNLTRLTIDDIPYYREEPLNLHSIDERINNSLYHLSGVPDKFFKSIDDIYQFAFSKHVPYILNLGWLFFEVPIDFHFGANIKYIKRQMFDRIGTGTGFDLSFMFNTDLSLLLDVEGLGDIALAANLQDVSGTEITWGETDNFHKDEILFNTKLGWAIKQPVKKLSSKVTVAYDVDYIYKTVSHYGVDWEYKSLANLRLGYYDKNYTAGASVNVYGAYVDYAIITNPLGLSNRIGLRLKF